MKRNLLIFGTGGAGRELIHYLTVENQIVQNDLPPWNIIGFLDDDSTLWGSEVNGVPVLGGLEWLKANGGNIAVSCLLAHPPQRSEFINKLVSIPTVEFPPIVTCSSLFSPATTKWGRGCILTGPLNFLTVNTQVGNFAFLNGLVRVGHDVVIGDYTTIFSDTNISGEVTIGRECLVGTAATILPRLKIGNRSIIGAGALVAENVPESVVVAGVPAKVIKEIK